MGSLFLRFWSTSFEILKGLVMFVASCYERKASFAPFVASDRSVRGKATFAPSFPPPTRCNTRLPSSFLFLVAMPGAPSSFLLLLVRHLLLEAMHLLLLAWHLFLLARGQTWSNRSSSLSAFALARLSALGSPCGGASAGVSTAFSAFSGEPHTS